MWRIIASPVATLRPSGSLLVRPFVFTYTSIPSILGGAFDERTQGENRRVGMRANGSGGGGGGVRGPIGSRGAFGPSDDIDVQVEFGSSEHVAEGRGGGGGHPQRAPRVPLHANVYGYQQVRLSLECNIPPIFVLVSLSFSSAPFGGENHRKHTNNQICQGQQAMGTAHRPGGPGPRSLVRLG